MSLDYRERPAGLSANPYLTEDDWTPKKGWKIAMKKIVFRTVIGFIVTVLMLLVLWPVMNMMPPMGGMLFVAFAFSGAVGLPMGYLVARKLKQDSGLAGRSLALPVMGILALSAFGAFKIVAVARGKPGLLVYGIGAGVGIWSVLYAFRTLAIN